MKRVVLTLLLALMLPFARADEGHSHGEAPAAATANGPQRLPDGSVFLPKPAQRQMGLRTRVLDEGELPRTIELNGRVTMDPNAGGRVQPMVAGRLEAGPRGLPSPGQPVKKGEVLAYVVQSASAIERSNQQAQLAELRAGQALARQRLARLEELADTVPRKDIEAARSELASFGQRAAAVSGGLATREALTAPVSGVVASVNAVLGQVVDARELLFEIVDPTRLRVEALAFDAALASDVAAAFVPVGNGRLALRFVGASPSLRDQGLPLVFDTQAGEGRAAGASDGSAVPTLAVGQPVKVIVQTRTRVKGAAVPAASLVKNASNQTTVWIKTAPERFEPRVVTSEALDGASVAATSGVKAGDRVVTQGATLLNQIR